MGYLPGVLHRVALLSHFTRSKCLLLYAHITSFLFRFPLYSKVDDVILWSLASICRNHRGLLLMSSASIHWFWELSSLLMSSFLDSKYLEIMLLGTLDYFADVTYLLCFCEGHELHRKILCFANDLIFFEVPFLEKIVSPFSLVMSSLFIP